MSANWNRVRLGLQLVYFSVCLILALIPASIIMAVMKVDPLTTAMVLQYTIIVAMIMSIVGPLLCLSVPEETRALPLIALSIVLSMLVLAFNLLKISILEQVFKLGNRDLYIAVLQYYDLIMFSMNVLSMAFFLLFCRQLGHYLRAESEERRATNLLQTGGFMLALMIGIILVIALGGAAGDLAMVLSVVMLGVLIAWLFWLISYGKLLIRLRTAIANFRGASGSESSGRLAD